MRCALGAPRSKTLFVRSISREGLMVSCLLALVAPAVFCSCNYRTTFQSAEVGTTVVAAVRVTSVDVSRGPSGPGNELPVRVRFGVDSSWSGGGRDSLDVWTGWWAGDCGYRFTVGDEYLLVAAPSHGRLITLTCMRPMPLKEATEDLRALGPATWRREAP